MVLNKYNNNPMILMTIDINDYIATHEKVSICIELVGQVWLHVNPNIKIFNTNLTPKILKIKWKTP